ncbi:MAG: transglycosylase SLT domain-containing protein [Candidatus Pacebacteria bacterium]|nr:transglycosylase SLT domain-containing protein [Candidatus Paceibacterota bacterium]
MAEYKLLEPDIAPAFGVTAPTFNGTPTLFASSSFIFTLSITIVIVAASFRYAYAGVLRLPASEEGIRKSKEEFRRVTYGLLGVLGLWLVLFTVNKDMLTGEVTLSALKSSGGGGGAGALTQTVPTTVPITNPTVTNPGSGTSAPCNNSESVKSSVSPSGAGICAGTSCSLTSCINSNPYTNMIKTIAGPDWKMALVIMCKESNGVQNAQFINRNAAGVITSYDCGLMQINQATACNENPAILDPQTNITRGVELLRGKIRASSNAQIYPALKVRPETAVFTSYNCCANGTVPNSQSESCKSADGWPSMPKWACPIDPGPLPFNMCGVKAYACDLTACLDSL